MAANILLNSAFDIDTDGDFLSDRNGVPDNWVRPNSGSDLFTWYDPRMFNTGFDTRLEVWMRDNVVQSTGQHLGLYQENVPAAFGQTLCFSLHMWWSNLVNANDLYLALEWHDAAHAVISRSELTFDGAALVTAPYATEGAQVVRPYVTAVAPVGTHHVKVEWGLVKVTAGSTPSAFRNNLYAGMAKVELGAVPTAWERNVLDVFPSSELRSPMQYFFNGLLFGHGTEYVVESLDGLLGGAPTRDADADRTNDHGATPGLVLMSKRILGLELKSAAGRSVTPGVGYDLETKLAMLQKTFQPPRIVSGLTTLPLYFWRPGQVRQFINVRCTKRDIQSNFQTARGLIAASVELQATDPMIYSAIPKTTNLTIPASGTSRASNLSPFADCPIEGDAVDGAHPVIEIFGPATNPTIGIFAPETKYMKFTINLAAGDSIRITAKTRKVEKNIAGAGYVEDYSIVKNDNVWWRLLPNVLNSLQFTRTNNPAVTALCIVTWNDVWN